MPHRNTTTLANEKIILGEYQQQISQIPEMATATGMSSTFSRIINKDIAPSPKSEKRKRSHSADAKMRPYIYYIMYYRFITQQLPPLRDSTPTLFCERAYHRYHTNRYRHR